MESMGKKKRRPRRSFAPEFKAEIVELCQRGDRSVGQMAQNFDLEEHPPVNGHTKTGLSLRRRPVATSRWVEATGRSGRGGVCLRA